MAPYDARAVANFLLDHAAKKNVSLTQLSLLKLIYFSHGWYLSRFGRPLVEDQFEAWEYGPVVRSVRDCFKSFSDRPINQRARRLNIFDGSISIVPSNLASLDGDFVRAVFDRYYIYTGWQLSEMTHEAGSPWDNIWNSETLVCRIGLRLKNSEIRAHFDALARREMLS